MQYWFFEDVTFDNDMQFVLFVGVNNRFQSIILAGVLMRHEQLKSFDRGVSKDDRRNRPENYRHRFGSVFSLQFTIRIFEHAHSCYLTVRRPEQNVCCLFNFY